MSAFHFLDSKVTCSSVYSHSLLEGFLSLFLLPVERHYSSCLEHLFQAMKRVKTDEKNTVKEKQVSYPQQE